jgi:hypothetical protein
MKLDTETLNWTSLPQVDSDQVSVQFADHRLEGDDLYVTMRFVVWDVEESSYNRGIRDIREQEVFVLSIEDSDRADNYLAALVATLSILVENVDFFLTHNPSELIPQSTHPMRLKTASSVEDFLTALRQRSRLGKYL